MVNVGGSFGPIIAGKLRAISWNHAFVAAAISIGVMLVITILFYEEPPRDTEDTGPGQTLGEKLKEIGTVLSDLKFSAFLVLLGVGFWLPFWAFFNLCALYVDESIDTAALYRSLEGVFGTTVADFFSKTGDDGVKRVLGETISHTGYIIMILQVFVSRWAERFRAMPVFMLGLAVAAVGFFVLGWARTGGAALVFLGIFLFALGEMMASPRIQEYITWLAPKEKAGLYMGTNFLALGIGGATSGVVYTSMYGSFVEEGSPQQIWYVLGVHVLVAVVALWAFARVAGEFAEQER
jgi:proton-dependent oligopeptide transporter, POT family